MMVFGDRTNAFSIVFFLEMLVVVLLGSKE